jgi:ribosomal protein S18 acetylase RimI-like enzyme
MASNTDAETEIPLTDLLIRQTTRADLPALEWDGEYWKFREVFADLFNRSLEGDVLLWIIVSPGGDMMGQAFVALRSGDRNVADGKTRAYVFSFRVKEKWRNRGVGSTLMKFIECDLRQRGFRYVTLNVAKDNPDALRLYRRMGYEVIDSCPGIWSYRDPDGIIHHVKEPSWRMLKSLSGKE